MIALLDEAVAKIVGTSSRKWRQGSWSIPLPTQREVYTVLRAVHKYKDAREQFEIRTHKTAYRYRRSKQTHSGILTEV